MKVFHDSHGPTTKHAGMAQFQPWFQRGMLAAGAILAAGTALALDPQLTAKGISAKGNLQLSVTGAPADTVVIESSANLSEWNPVGSLQLTNGSARFYLPPADDFAFLRTRSVDPSILPASPSFTPKVNADFVKTRFENGDGQTLRILDDAGYTYEIVLTEDALADSAVIKFEVVNQAAGFPAGWNYLTGIQISPFSIPLLGESTLTITAPAGKPFGSVAAVAWNTDGTQVHLVPRTASGTQVTIPLNHLGGFGLCTYPSPLSGPLATSAPIQAVAELEQRLALAQLKGVLPLRQSSSPQRKGGGSSARPLADSESAQYLANELRSLATHHLRTALYSDMYLESSLQEYNGMGALLDPLLADPRNTDLAQVAQEIDALAIQALNASIDRAFERCKSGNLRALIRLYRDVRFTRRGRVARAISVAQRARFKDLIERAARFKFELLSSTAYRINSGTVLSSVSATFTLAFPPAEIGAPKNRISGTATTTIDTTSWNNPPGGCAVRSSPVPGNGAVYRLSIYTPDLDIDSHIVSTDEDFAIPHLSLEWDPFTVAPLEKYVLTCAGFEIPQPGGFWGSAFGALHKDEIQRTADGRQVLFVDTLRFDGQKEFRKEYLREGAVGSGSASETTDLRITFLGVE